MAHWLRFTHQGSTGFGMVDKDTIQVCTGDLFDGAKPTGERLTLDAVRVLMPCQPTKMLGLWNNFAARADVEKLQRPNHPLWFVKTNNCFMAHGEPIRRPAGYAGLVVFEGELGVVIGKPCRNIDESEADDYIFGYTCVNDVTAREILRSDPSFPQWCRAKSFDSFGPFGPRIATGIEPDALTVRTLVNGEEKQNYPVADMFFRPREIVSRLSQDMTLMPGDIIACGTSLGAGPIREGDKVEIVIDGVGRLTNCFS
ncbi:MAG: fumarylacetoacetate hydrolase family protein [Betaproteobacteria bacterium]|nr:fumarylacetoacetate hydrolase family protein [Betaproteobacteria bacterium]